MNTAVQTATPADVAEWRALAAEVEPLFGPMVGLPSFEQALARNIERGTAFCVRAGGGAPGSALLGALMFSVIHAPIYHIGWLAVRASARRMGIGRMLVNHVAGLAVPPAIIEVVTFTSEQPGGAAARQFYIALGFAPAEMTWFGVERIPRQIFRLKLP